MGEVAAGLEKGLVGGDYDVLAEVARHGDGEWIAKDHAEALLINRMLTSGLGDFLLARVSLERVLELCVGNEAGANLVNVLSLKSLLGQGLCEVKLDLLGGFDEPRFGLEAKSSKSANIDPSPSLHILLNIGTCRSHDQVELLTNK